MADETFTKEQLDKAIADAVAKVQESIDRLESKNEQLIGENRKLKRGAEIKPEDLQAAEDRADKAEAALSEANKQLKAVTGERDKAVKSLETEQGAARSYALDAEIAAAIAAGNVVPALVPAFTAMVKQQAKAELVDGKYAVSIGDKAAKDYITTFLGSEEGKHFKAAAANGGGGAPGGNGGAQTARRCFALRSTRFRPSNSMPSSRKAARSVDAAA
jgi:hypothetical protein